MNISDPDVWWAFLSDIPKKQNPNLRWGQCYFNVLMNNHPEIANEIAGTDNDPFYDDKKLKGFFATLF